MPFQDVFENIPFDELLKISAGADDRDVDEALAARRPNLYHAAALLSPAASRRLEDLASAARSITLQRFGRVIQLYAPLYISNECVDTCAYCGFSRENQIARLTLSVDQVAQEARILYDQGFRHLLLVSGEHPRIVSIDYIEKIIRELRPFIPSLSVEVAPQEIEPYRRWVAAGVDGLVVYQETYDKKVYAAVHLAGKKKDFNWRLAAPERGGEAGFRRLGIGALLGLADWRHETLALAAHTDYLMRHTWQSMVTISLPRLRPAAGGYAAPHAVSDRELVQMIAALRILLPDVGIVLSTRERASLRDKLVHLGVTQMSAGSKTNPGGYSRQVADSECQFEIEDTRSAAQIARMLDAAGYEPVWKDWDRELHAANL